MTGSGRVSVRPPLPRMAAAAAGGGGRKLRPWLVAQVESGRFAGLVWDDAGRSALRIPWQHAGKGGAKGGAGTALCQVMTTSG